MFALDIDSEVIEKYWCEVGKRLETARLRTGLNKTEVAKQFGITLGRLANFEYGTRKPNYFQLEEFARFYGVSAAWLAGYEIDHSNLVHLSQEQTKEDDNFALTKDWLNQRNLTKDDVSTVPVNDDCMDPVLHKSDHIVINKKAILSEKKDLFAIKVHEKIWFRWLQETEDGDVIIESLNEDVFFPDQKVSKEKFSQIEVLGRAEVIFRER
ncbi:XRE family transcriptional regulator [Spartinivicinus ruber]|uniref:XRE family transcriptional regulator n=1 Tax=Spartinivicinus ruber TaxID=2683272 RepID=UPI0013CFBFF4|nr:LexA family transcriptional regulator [Spartinivicinus ruber]